MKVPLSRPDITEREVEAVLEVLRSPFLSTGPKVEAFEHAVAAYVGAKHGIAVNSGTSGLHLLVRAFGIGPQDEVITTPFSFVASSNVILYEHAKPVFVDVDSRTLNIDPTAVEAAITPRTKAILGVDVFGQPARWDEIRAVANRYGLRVIEDSCESLGAQYKGMRTGSSAFGHGAVFAFYPNKQITTGEGGLITTDDDEVARLCRSLRNQGRGDANVWLSHENLGYNYRLDEMSAALGLAQMDRIEEILVARDRVAQAYHRRLSGMEGVTVPYVEPNVRMSWFVYVVHVDEDVDRDKVMEYLLANGVGCRTYFSPIHLQPYYRRLLGHKEGDFPIAEDAGRRSIALPFHNNLSESEQDYVVEVLHQAIRHCRNGHR